MLRPGAEEGSEAASASAAVESADDRSVIAFIGTSLTAGYGLLDPRDRFTDLLQKRIDESGLAFRVVNAGVSGDTSRGGLERIDRVLRSDPRVLVIELGANDGLRGIDPESMGRNLQAIIDRSRAFRADVEVVIVEMEAPPNLGAAYVDRFRRVFTELAESNGATLLPFLLDGVAGVPELNQADGIHPTEEGHALIADRVWRGLEPLLTELGADSP